eukprot:TRINITY_DN58269_c0_g1_i1.p1 TRINITY_DN58269_c0_g1~~TRINITY_DN58269_c0_g1_i1.p1  ORF type:complete len:272 (-),score=74.16 TRINITY_DN58269_c0_g1_i1:88-903(-)
MQAVPPRARPRARPKTMADVANRKPRKLLKRWLQQRHRPLVRLRQQAARLRDSLAADGVGNDAAPPTAAALLAVRDTERRNLALRAVRLVDAQRRQLGAEDEAEAVLLARSEKVYRNLVTRAENGRSASNATRENGGSASNGRGGRDQHRVKAAALRKPSALTRRYTVEEILRRKHLQDVSTAEDSSFSGASSSSAPAAANGAAPPTPLFAPRRRSCERGTPSSGRRQLEKDTSAALNGQPSRHQHATLSNKNGLDGSNGKSSSQFVGGGK